MVDNGKAHGAPSIVQEYGALLRIMKQGKSYLHPVSVLSRRVLSSNAKIYTRIVQVGLWIVNHVVLEVATVIHGVIHGPTMWFAKLALFLLYLRIFSSNRMTKSPSVSELLSASSSILPSQSLCTLDAFNGLTLAS